MMTKKLFAKKKDDAISPVIGTILMVAATVIIAGAVYAAVNAYNGKTAKSAPDAAFKAQALDTDGNGLEDMIKVTYLSGPSGVANANVSVSSSDGANTIAWGTDPGTWDAGDYRTFTGTPGSGSYFVTVRMGDSTLLEQTLSLKE